ncbi:MAG TPA: hypothetical protein VMD59_23410, partial [Acidimicrobiales bacterium]|nr:hypothetical protein [Acidimicrobiales bacterium]
LATPDRELQEQLAQRVVDEGLSVRTLEELVRSAQRSAASFEDGSGQPSAPPGGESGERPVSGKTSALHVPPVGGNGSGPQPRTAAQPVPGGLRPPGVLELEELLADHLNTRVRVEMSARHGRVVVEFANLEDLERIYRLMIG